MAKIKLTRELDYVVGHLRNGHLELFVDENEWNSMSDEDKRDFFGDNAEVVVDGYEVEDYDWSDTSEIEEELV